MEERCYSPMHSGILFPLLDPDPALVTIEDIAWALSHQARFGGNTIAPYYTAQHCVIVAMNCPALLRPAALLHDSDEAYMVDLPRRLKKYGGFSDRWESIADAIRAAVFTRFKVESGTTVGLNWEIITSVDRRAAAAEIRDIGSPSWPRPEGVVPLDETIRPWSSWEAQAAFLGLFGDLFNKEGR